MAKKDRPKIVPEAALLEDALKQVQNREEPYINGSDSIGVLRVADPESAEKEIRSKVTNLRGDPVGNMHKRGQLGEINNDGTGLGDLRLRASRCWQADYERAVIGGARAIDPMRPKIDGGRFIVPDSAAQTSAQDKLNQVGAALGKEGSNLILRVLGERRTLREVADMFGQLEGSRRAIEKALDYLGRRLRECLDTIAAEYRLAHGKGGGVGPKRARDRFDRSFADFAATGQNAPLYTAVKRAQIAKATDTGAGSVQKPSGRH